MLALLLMAVLLAIGVALAVVDAAGETVRVTTLLSCVLLSEEVAFLADEVVEGADSRMLAMRFPSPREQHVALSDPQQ